MRIVKPDKEGVKLAVRYLKSGKSVVYPTDTCYGLAVDATDLKAVKKLWRIKERGPRQPIHVIIASFAQAKGIAKFNPLAEKLFKKFLPGPLTLVLKLESGIANYKSLKLLSAGTGTIGVRMPDNRIALALAKKLGRPITSTSANPSARLSGGYSPYTAADVVFQFKKKRYQPDLIINAGRLPKVKPSTIVDLTGSNVKIIRKGPIKLKEILKYAQT